MNKRLIQFLAAENISQAQFADTIDVARASVSHIIAGRNKPGFDFLESTALHYPELNLEWLITGKGRMYKGQQAAEPAEAEDSLFMGEETATPLPDPAPPLPRRQTETDRPPADREKGGGRKITKVIAFFSDDTFQEIV